jgi:hypothetical protein
MSTQTQQSPLVCDLAALGDTERRKHVGVSEEMFAALQDVKELPDGYGFRFPATMEMLQTVATFVARERKCCPFYTFTVKVEREGGPMWLHLTGREGVKEYVRMEMKGHEQLAPYF